MTILRKLQRVVRGEVAAKTIVREVARRSRVSIRQWRERANVERRGKQAARLLPRFSRMKAAELLEHFQHRTEPLFLPGLSEPPGRHADSQQRLFPKETSELVAAAERIVSNHSWPLLGLGDKSFGTPINWHLDPLSGRTWPLEYHADINLFRGDGSDVRTLWELNRLQHFITLARAYRVTNDERFGVEFFQQVESWHSANPLGRGVNWKCAMEVALRAMNLLGAFEVFRHSRHLDEEILARMLAIFDQHGSFIRRNLENLYFATSNHYLSDVTGLVWLGVVLPELERAGAWRHFGLGELLNEMDKQVLADGADFEASTGYHRYVLELFLYTFILCRSNGIEIENRYWRKLQDMLHYVRGYLRPDGHAPLIGDSDSGQVFPISRRSADDHAYMPAIGAAVFNDPQLRPFGFAMPEEVFWILGEQGVDAYQRLTPVETHAGSHGFPDAGTYILRDRDLYLLFNTSGAGINGRGSHGHNDALSIEVSACGRSFITDPGTYVYTADLGERHRFRSTAYHSTVQIDGLEQNTTNQDMPFVIGDEAHPRVLSWETGVEFDRVSAEHGGYARLPQPVTHRRTVVFNKRERWWLVEDEFYGVGEHNLAVRFQFDTGIEVGLYADMIALGWDKTSGARLFICPLDQKQEPVFESQFTSRDYGSKLFSQTACWSVRARMPSKFSWAIVPVCSSENEEERLKSFQRIPPTERRDSRPGN